MRTLRIALAAAASAALFASIAGCNGADADADPGLDDPGKADVKSPEYVKCDAVFRWLQKDAYASRAGRTSDLWPPHTTTVLEVRCPDQAPMKVVRENHGTLPGAKDAAGNEILVEVRTAGPVKASLSKMKRLMAAFESCECQPATEFLSLDGLGNDKAMALLAQLGGYVATNMQCDDLAIEELRSNLQTGQFDAVLASLASCHWASGEDWATGFATASRVVLGAEFTKYHVCNNDAALQTQLWTDFVAGGNPVACDASGSLCKGPAFFYTPPAAAAE